MKKDKKFARIRRHSRIRKKIFGTLERPRLSVFRSTKHIYVQAIDDRKGFTLATASTLTADLPEIEGDMKGKRRNAKRVGKKIAQILLEQGIKQVIFDRGGCLYHGRIAALAEGAREGGLQF